MEFNSYIIKAAGRGGHRRLTVLGNEAGAVRFARDRRDTRAWELQGHGCWSRPATKKERVALLVNADGAEQHRIRHLQWASHKLWERKHDFVNALRLIGAYCATWPLMPALPPEALIAALNDVKPWAWRPVGFAGADNLIEAIALLDREISHYREMDDEEAAEEEYNLLRNDEDWVGIYNGHLICCAKELEAAERDMWESRLRLRLLRAVRSVSAS